MRTYFAVILPWSTSMIVGHVALGELAGFEHERELLGGFLDLDHVADLER